MKTTLPTEIKTSEEAKAFLTALHQNGESFHPEDSAADTINANTGEDMFTDEEACTIDILMCQVYHCADFDPCELFLNLINNS